MRELTERERAIVAEIRTRPTVAEGIVSRSAVGRQQLVEYQPGNGTRYVLLFTPLDEFANAERATGHHYDSWVVTDLSTGYRALILDEHSYLDPWTLAEKLDSSLPDAVAIGELCAHVLGCSTLNCEGFARLCRSRRSAAT